MTDTVLLNFIAKQTELLNKAIEKIGNLEKAGPSTIKTEVDHSEKTMNALAKNMCDFSYDPENSVTFQNWYLRYADWFEVDAAHLDDAAKVRLLLRKLDTTAHSRYINFILPKQPKELSFSETKKVLENIFDRQMSLLNIRYNCLKITKKSEEDYISYACVVNRQCEEFQLSKLTNNQFKCLMFVCGLNSSSDADIRTKLLSKMDSSDTLTLEDLTSETKRLIALKHDTNMIESNLVHQVHRYNNNNSDGFHKNKNNNNHNNNNNSVGVNNRSDKKPKSPCWYCGDFHFVQYCPFKNHKCTQCQNIGHKEGYCAAKPFKQSHHNNKQHKPQQFYRKGSSTNTNGVYMVSKINFSANRKFITVNINNVPTILQIDTASDISIISLDNYNKIGKPVTQKCKHTARNASGETLNIISQFDCQVTLNNQTIKTTCFVTNIHNLNLFGIEWIQKFNLWDVPINNICNQVNCDLITKTNFVLDFQQKFPDVFSDDLGTCKKTTATLHLKPNTQTVFRPKRPVPYASLPAVDTEINRLEQMGVISSVDFSSWAAPIVVTKKSNGAVRICADFSTGLNAVLEPHQYPLPLPEDIFATLAGGRIFSKIDCADAYLQVLVDEKSKQLLTINTHRGLYQYNRLCFGIKSAPGIFQQIMDTMLAGLCGIVSYLDDIIVVGKTINEHHQQLNELFKRISEWGFHIKGEKCSFFQPSINYLGFIVDSNGRRPDPSKTAAIINMPAPTNISTLRSFIGMINYYGQFISNMRELRAPFDLLLKKNCDFYWSQHCQQSFVKVKDILQSELLLTHFDPALTIKVAADASQYGLGAVILHVFPDKSEKAIAHAARALTPAEQNYSQIEKEGLALIFAITKFHRMLYGRRFVLSTDHKPLLSIFGSKKGIPLHTANRLQRWALTLLSYDFIIEHVGTTKFGHADVLSRLLKRTENTTVSDEDPVIAAVEADINQIITESVRSLPLTNEMITQATSEDKILQKILKYLRSAWPNKINDNTLRIFQSRSEALSEQNGCILYCDRIVIPLKLQNQILTQLHSGHPGIVRMKSLARSYVYWPNIDQQIEQLVKSCEKCSLASKAPTKTTLSSWPLATSPWERVHIDFAGPFQDHNFLIVVDSYTKWPEIIIMSNTTTNSTIIQLKLIFARFGLPKILVSDNGTQFTAAEFKEFCAHNGISHLRSPPYHPQSNGQAERFVDTFKRSLLKMKGEGITAEILSTFLYTYRTTPNKSLPDNMSPAELMFGRKCRTKFDLLFPDKNKNIIHDSIMEESFNKQHGAKQRSYMPNDKVYVMNYMRQKRIWLPGTIVKRIGKVTYMVDIDHRIVHRHANQIRRRDGEISVKVNNSLPLDILIDTFNVKPTNNQASDQQSTSTDILPNSTTSALSPSPSSSSSPSPSSLTSSSSVPLPLTSNQNQEIEITTNSGNNTDENGYALRKRKDINYKC